MGDERAAVCPPRRVVSTRNDGLEILTCGHEMRPRHDMIGETSVEKRRCAECLRLAQAGEPVPDVPSETATEREARLVHKATVAVLHPLRRVERCSDLPVGLLQHVVVVRRALFPESTDVASRRGTLQWGALVDLDMELHALRRRKGLDPALRDLVDQLVEAMFEIHPSSLSGDGRQ